MRMSGLVLCRRKDGRQLRVSVWRFGTGAVVAERDNKNCQAAETGWLSGRQTDRATVGRKYLLRPW